MTAAVLCGTKRSFFEDIPSPPSFSKRFRRCSYSPICSSSIDHHANTLYSEEKKAEESAAVASETEAPTATENLNLPVNGDEWVELLVREVMQSTGKDDAKVRAGRVLEALEKMITARAHEEAGKKFQEETVAVQQQVETLVKDNTVLKRAVTIQHERQKTCDDANQQLELIKKLIPEYQANLRNLELNNYALRMQIQQLEHGNSMPKNFNPHVF